MDKTLIFLCVACCIVMFSIIVICTGPIISGLGSVWNYQNCKIYSDFKNYVDDSKVIGDQEIRENYVNYYKKGRNLCNRQKATYGLEYASLIVDVVLGFLCALLSLFHYFGIGKNFEKYTGLIGLISGIIGFILTLVYICYSGYIFTHDSFNVSYSTSLTPFTGSPSPYDGESIIKLNKDRAFAEWDDSKKKYICIYYKDDDLDSFYAKYSDLGKKQYNYNKEIYLDNTSKKTKFNKCIESTLVDANDVQAYCKNPTDYSGSLPARPTYGDNNEKCQYLYFNNNASENEISFKYFYDKWVTSLIFGCFIIALNICLAIFGFLLFAQGNNSSGHTPV